MKKDKNENAYTIEKIYICKTNTEDLSLIEKILVQYSDGDCGFLMLPPNYNRLSARKKENIKL